MKERKAIVEPILVSEEINSKEQAYEGSALSL